MKGNIFIKRPVMAICISVLILVIGLISLFTLPVEQYPDIAPPTVYVTANYTGADADAVMNSVVMPLEESINGVENMMYISSTATNAGSAVIQVYFKQGTDPDMAAVNVQNRVSKAQGLLPAEVTRIGVTTQKRQTSFLQIGAMVCTDGRYDQTFLANYLDINVIPQIKRIEGVGDVMELGDTYSMRIWLRPERMAQYGLVPSDVTAVLGEAMAAIPRIAQPALGGGALLDIGVYALTMACLALEGDVERVGGVCVQNGLGADIEESISLRFSGGACASLAVSARCAAPHRAAVCCGGGRIEIDGPLWSPAAMTVYGGTGTDAPRETIRFDNTGTGFEPEVRAVAAALAAGRTECPALPAAETLRVLRAADALRALWGVRYPGEA